MVTCVGHSHRHAFAPPTNAHPYQRSAGFISEEERDDPREYLLAEPGELSHEERKLANSADTDEEHEPYSNACPPRKILDV